MSSSLKGGKVSLELLELKTGSCFGTALESLQWAA